MTFRSAPSPGRLVTFLHRDFQRDFHPCTVFEIYTLCSQHQDHPLIVAMFHDGDLQSGITHAVQSQKAVLCFVYGSIFAPADPHIADCRADESASSVDWESALSDPQIRPAIESQTVAMKLKADSQEATFLSGICPVHSVPAIIVIRNATVELNLQANQTSLQVLKERLKVVFASEQTPTDGARSQTHTSVPMSAEETATTSENSASGSSLDATASHTGYLDLQPSSGRFRLPNNAYDALRQHTQSLLDADEPPEQILNSQLSLLDRLPIFREEVTSIRSRSLTNPVALSDSATDRLLRLPASAIKAQSGTITNNASSSAGQRVYASQASDTPTQATNAPPLPPYEPPTNPEAPSDPPSYSVSQHDTQRSDYARMQRQREQSQRDERERIKLQIKADREERRRREQVSKQNEGAAATEAVSSTSPRPRSGETRIQVRTFDGTLLRTTFPPTSTITANLRPWIDELTESMAPYNLKLILTPLPNRNIEAGEEELALTDLGIRGSCTFVMVPVKGYVESYTGNTPTGLVGSAVSGGYNLVTGTVGAVFGSVKGIIRGLGPHPKQPAAEQTESTPAQTANQRNVRVRTLADQRREEGARDQQFYNGNTLNFAPNRDEDESRKDD